MPIQHSVDMRSSTQGELGEYLSILELARGDTGVVSLAIAGGGGRASTELFALREVSPALLDEPTVLVRFLEEARLAVRLDHRHIVRTIEAGRDGARHFIATEYLAGQPLHRLLARAHKRGVAIPLRWQLAVLQSALEGLAWAAAALDERGAPLPIVHGAMKPGNVLVGYEGQVKVLGFGLASVVDEARRRDGARPVSQGSYRSPERAAGGPPDARGDVYSFGAMLYEAATGAPFWALAFDGPESGRHSTPGANSSCERHHAPESAPPPLRQVIARATALDPSQRQADAGQLLIELRAALGPDDAPPVSRQDVARLTRELFGEERVWLRTAIDEAMGMYRRALSGQYAATRDAPASFGAGRDNAHESPAGTETAAIESGAPRVTVPQSASVLGKYRLLAELARGGMGVVYLALLHGPADFHKLLVIKELRRDLADDHAFVRMFHHEARLAARLNHPNIVLTMDLGSDGERHFIAMEYLEGQPLKRFVRRAQRLGVSLPLHVHMRILIDVLFALGYVHELADFDGTPLRLVHRDVSPRNVFITYEGHVKLIDFGIAKMASALPETRAGLLKGRVKYMAPEYAAGGLVDGRADVYAVGVMLWEAIAGVHPWDDHDELELLPRLIAGAVPRFGEVHPEVDAALATIVERATCVQPEGRYPTAAAMRDDLECYARRHKERWPMLPSTASAVPTAVTVRSGIAILLAELFAEDRRKVAESVETSLRSCLHGWESQEQRGSINPAPQLTMTSSVAPERHVPLPVLAPAVSHVARRGAVLRRVPIAVGAAALGTSIAALSLTASRIRQPPPRAAAQAETVIAAPAVVLAKPTVHVAIRVSPSWAAVFLDDALVANPYSADRTRDAVAHRVRAEAPGYDTTDTSMAFDGDLVLQVELARQATPESRPRGDSASRPAPGSVPSPELQSRSRPTTQSVPFPAAGRAAVRPGDHPGVTQASDPGSAGAREEAPAAPTRDIDRESPYRR